MATPLLRGELFQRRVIVGLIPRDVHGDGRADTGQAVTFAGVFKFFMNGAGFAGLGKYAEARTAWAVAPRRRLAAERSDPLADFFGV